MIKKINQHKRENRFLCGKPHTNCGDKKPRGVRPQIYNSLYKIKIHSFT